MAHTIMSESLQKKVQFVKEISRSVAKVQKNIKNIEYRIYQNKEYEDWQHEYLVVNYTGGARTVRNCNGNSCSAILEEIARYLRSGYYDEVKDLVNLERDPAHWELLAYIPDREEREDI